MNLANRFAVAVAAVAWTLVAVAPAMAQLEADATPDYFGTVRVDMLNNRQTWTPNQADIAGDVYNNTNPQAPANFGFSSTDLNSTFGDRVATTGKGILQQADYTVFNSAGGPLLTATYLISYFDGTTGNPLGSFNSLVNFGTGLPVGSFAIVTSINLGVFNININTQDVIVTQKRVASTGTTTKLGIASLDPPTIGSSSNTMYISSSTVGGGAPGFYNIGTPPLNANPGYRINVSTATPAEHGSWGKVKALYHS